MYVCLYLCERFRYGSLFRTNIFGSNTVVISDPDVIFDIFRKDNKSFALGYPDVFLKMFGKDNLVMEQGNIHKHAKQVTLQFIGSEGLKRNLIGDMDRATREVLRSKAIQGSFDVKEAVESVCVHITLVLSNEN